MFVFVYGTLKQSKPNHGWIANEQFMGVGFSCQVTMYKPNSSFPYPFCLLSDDSDGVYGEVYKVDDEGLKQLDILEGYPELYTRDTINVTLEGGKVIEALCYLLNIKVDTNNFESIIKF